MTVVTPSQSNSGDTIEASDINNPVNQLAAVINGGIDATNITDGSISTVKLADGAVTPAKLVTGSGGSWVYQTYTPTWTAATTAPTIGNGTLAGNYTQVGKTVHFRINLSFGSTTSIGSGAYTFSLPVTAAASIAFSFPIGVSFLEKPGTADYMGIVVANTSTTVQVLPVLSGGSAGAADTVGLVGSATPAAWGTSSFIRLSGTYEAA